MLRRMFMGKIHRAVITHADLDYEGSVTIDQHLMDRAGILENEEVHIWNVTRGTRLTTYALTGPAHSGVICVNGAAAHHHRPGDQVILAAFGSFTDEEAREHRPKVVLVDGDNRVVHTGPEEAGPKKPRAVQRVPNSRSPASPKPGTM